MNTYNKCNIFGNPLEMQNDNKINISLDVLKIAENKKIMKNLAEGCTIPLI